MATAALVTVLMAIIPVGMLVTSRLSRTHPIADDVAAVEIEPESGGPITPAPAPAIPGVRYRSEVNVVALLARDEARAGVEAVLGAVDLPHFGAHLIEIPWSAGTAPIFEDFGVDTVSTVAIVDGAGVLRRRLAAEQVEPRTVRWALRQAARDAAGRSR